MQEHPKGIPGKYVVGAFFALVIVISTGLWITLQDAKRKYIEANRAADASLAAHAVQPGWYRVELDTTDEGPLPFYVEFPAGDGVAHIVNGEETLDAEFRAMPNGGVLDFPHLDTRVEFTSLTDGSLSGTYFKTYTGGVVQMMTASASRVDGPDPAGRFAPFFGSDADGPADFSGVWRMEFEKDRTAKGVFAQSDNGVLRGTIVTPTGDYRYLAGNVEGRQLRLSVFDGAHAFLFTGAMNESGDAFTGVFRSNESHRDTFTATRDVDFELPNPLDEVSLKPGVTRLSLPQLNQPPYKGAPTIVTAFGTWCPNCNDLAPELVRFYEKYHDQGLEILGLAYERTDDPERSARQIERYQERYGAEWQILQSGVSEKDKTAATLPDLNAFRAYPTTIFVNRDGTVRAIHSGFFGPGAGEQYSETVQRFDRLINEILASPAP